MEDKIQSKNNLPIVNTTGYYFPVVEVLCNRFAESEACGFIAKRIHVGIYGDTFVVEVVGDNNCGSTIYTIPADAYKATFPFWATMENAGLYRLYHFSCLSFLGSNRKGWNPEAAAVWDSQFHAELLATMSGQEAQAWALYYARNKGSVHEDTADPEDGLACQFLNRELADGTKVFNCRFNYDL